MSTPEGDVGLEQALGPVQWPQPLVEVAQDVGESLGRPQGVDAVGRGQLHHPIEGGDLPGAHTQQVDPGRHPRSPVGILCVAGAGGRPGDRDDADDGQLVWTDLHRSGGAGLR